MENRRDLRGRGGARLAVVAVVAAGLAAVVAAVAAQEGVQEKALERGPESAAEGTVEVWVGAAAGGELPPAERLEVLDGGRPVAVEDLGELGGPLPVTIYLDQRLASPLSFHNATLQLAERAPALTRLGPVELVLGGEEVRTALPATDDPDALAQGLAWLRLRESAEDLQADLRRELLEELELLAAWEAGGPLAVPAGDAERVAAARRLEEAVLAEAREGLLFWASREAPAGPRVLILAGDGFDDAPPAFYGRLGGGSAGAPPAAAAPAPSLDELAQVLAAYGWITLPFVPTTRGDQLLAGEPDDEPQQEGADKVDVVLQDGRLVDRTRVGFDPRKVLEKVRERRLEGSRSPLVAPLEPLKRMAEATGGELLADPLAFDAALAALPRRRRLRWAHPYGPAGLRPVEVREAGAPAGPRLAARRWVAGATPEAVAAVRAGRLLEGTLDEGELPVEAAVESRPDGSARLLLRLESAAADAGPLRVTLAEAPAAGPDDAFGGGAPRVTHRLTEGGAAVRDGILELPLPAEPAGLLAVLVEELTAGRWGGAFATSLEAASLEEALEAGPGPAGAAAGGALLLPAPKAIHLLAPQQPLVMGQVTFESVISQERVARVDFLLDGEPQVVRRGPPFAAVLDLGPLPQPRRVEAVAFDATGSVLGSDYLIVNQGSGVFRVRIVQPSGETTGTEADRLVGPVDVEAEVEPRRGTSIDRVEFFWKERRVATRWARPYRQRVVIPPAEPKGFLRVVAYLEDGSSSEDVLFVNSPGSSERLQVNLIELYVVVTDRQGRPVQGLTRNRFEVLENGVAQEIATFSDAGELPLTVGLAVDSSASMFVKLPRVQTAASDFLRRLATRRDRAFVVGFGSEPRLARTTTSDLPAAIRALDALQPDGQTAIWKAIVYSLVQLQGVPGKKALIVYTDGADEDPDFSYRTCLRFARKVGVPIYVILSNNEIVRTDGRGLAVRSFISRLENLTSAVGGRVFLARVGEDLEAVYGRIEEELRSQYLLGFYSRGSGTPEWRQVAVDVKGSGLEARSIAGYFR